MINRRRLTHRAIGSPRVRLEPLRDAHAEALFDGLQGEQIYRFIEEDPPRDLPALRERYRQLQRRTSPDGSETWLNWAVWSLVEERYIGYVQATIRSDDCALIAYVLFPDAWGRGYGADAVALMLDELITIHGVREAFATVDERNHASIALLRKMGFKQRDKRERKAADLMFHVRLDAK